MCFVCVLCVFLVFFLYVISFFLWGCGFCFFDVFFILFNSEMVKLMNLSHDWLQSLLPHVLSKINRVSFGLLSKEDLERQLAGSSSSSSFPFFFP